MFQPDGQSISIDRTFLPALPRATALTVRVVTPEEFHVTFPLEAHALKHGLLFLLWLPMMLPLMIGAVALGALFPQVPFFLWVALAFFVPLWIAAPIGRRFRRPDGGQLRLECAQLNSAGGAVVRWSRVHPIGASSKFAVVSSESSDDTLSWLLKLHDAGKDVVITNDSVLNVSDLRWLCDRFNEWLGWEFPSHCVACGRPLTQADMNWRHRCVQCSGCGYRGPAPDPFDEEAISPPPPAACPNCAEPIRLTQIDRASGGCRCRECGWESEAAPPLRPRDFAGFVDYCSAVVARSTAMAFRFPQYLVSNDELIKEFPTPDSAWSQLSNDNLIEQVQGRLPTVTYKHWQTRGFATVVAALTGGIVSLIVLLATVLGGPEENRAWLQFFAVWACRLGLLVLSGAFLAAIWWGRRQTMLLFSRQALAWECAGRRRIATWHTLGDVAVQRRGWPPMFVLMHGGAGIVFAPPTKAAARAMARLSLAYRDPALWPSDQITTEVIRSTPNS